MATKYCTYFWELNEGDELVPEAFSATWPERLDRGDWTHVYLASDYDALASELATAKQLNSSWLRENGPGGWIDVLRERNKTLERALRKYGVHINDCPQNLLQPECDLQERCTCGFSEVLK
jgi:hypothetical protein